VTIGENYCPKDCHFFNSKAEAQEEALRQRLEKSNKERRERRNERITAIFRFVTAPFRWFGQLPWQTQVLIIVLAILLFSPKWGPVIIEVIKAIK
jgi:hypothetical protein